LCPSATAISYLKLLPNSHPHHRNGVMGFIAFDCELILWWNF
jgi:hypothetical protein